MPIFYTNGSIDCILLDDTLKDLLENIHSSVLKSKEKYHQNKFLSIFLCFTEYIQIINIINVATRHMWVISIPMLISDKKCSFANSKNALTKCICNYFLMPQLLQIVLGV